PSRPILRRGADAAPAHDLPVLESNVPRRILFGPALAHAGRPKSGRRRRPAERCPKKPGRRAVSAAKSKAALADATQPNSNGVCRGKRQRQKAQARSEKQKAKSEKRKAKES